MEEIMKKEETAATKDSELEILEIAEFKRSDSRKEIVKYEAEERRKRMILCRISAVFVAGFLIAVLLGLFVFRLPVVLVCTVLVLETVIAVCLHNEPVWIHGVEMVVGIGAGMVFGEPVFMIVGALVYFGAILALHGMTRE